LCDVTNPLCGPNGSARVFGPQKGATPEMVETMEAGMAHLATIFERNKGPKLADMPCAGAAGGCGAGVVAFLNGRLLSGSDALLDLMNFSALAADADLIVTGEGMVDDQTAGGKLVSAVAARANGTPVVVLAGGIAEGTNLEALYEKGVTAVMPVTSRPMTLGEAMSSGAEGVRLTATQLFRLAGALKA
ncbi:MAG: glycerate kinase, partial [Sutterella wadsworthensis]